jgi:integrase
MDAVEARYDGQGYGEFKSDVGEAVVELLNPIRERYETYLADPGELERLLRRGADPSTLRNALMPLRVICRRARNRGYLVVNPTEGLELPAVRSRRDRIADPVEAAALLAAVPELDRPAWATAMYAGLRLGELQALRVEDIDLDEEVIHVRRGWDQYEGEQEPKSRAVCRRVPIARLLRPHLEAALARRSTGLVFGRTAEQPFAPRTLNRRADRAWKAVGLNPIGFHECRHTFASLMIAAGVNAKALQTFMGHASITVTLDLYGHLMPGAEAEAAGLLNAYLGRYETVRGEVVGK